MRSIPFRELQKHYPEDLLSEVKIQSHALSDIDSKTSVCWGAGQIMTGNWVTLARLSPGTPRGKATQFVCKLKLVKDHPYVKEKLADKEKDKKYPPGYMQGRGAA